MPIRRNKGPVRLARKVPTVNKYNREERKANFLKLFAESGNVGAVLLDKRVDVSRTEFNKWRNTDPEFKEKYQEVYEQFTDRLEKESLRIATEGYEENVYQRGVKVGTRKVYVPTLMAFLLTGRRREVYGSKVEIGLTPTELAAEVRKAIATEDEAAMKALGTSPSGAEVVAEQPALPAATGSAKD